MRTMGASSPPDEESTTTGMLEKLREEGNLRPRHPAAAGGKGEVLRSERLGPRSPAPCSNGHRRKRWSDRGVARKRRRDRRMVFEVLFSGVLAAPSSWLRKG